MNSFNILAKVTTNCDDPGLAIIISIFREVISIIQIIAPIILLVFATIGFIRLVTNPDDKKSVKSLTNKFIAAAVVILIPVVVEIAINLTSEKVDFAKCWKAAEEMKKRMDDTPYEVRKLKDKDKKKITFRDVKLSTDDGEGGSSVAPYSTVGHAVIAEAKKYVGNRYVWGGNSLTNGVDCSGFIQQLYMKFGIVLPRTSGSQGGAGTAVNGLENAQAGDILAYPGHVALFMGNGQMIHAANAKRGIVIDSVRTNGLQAIRRVS